MKINLFWRSSNDVFLSNAIGYIYCLHEKKLFCFKNKPTPSPKSRLKYANVPVNDVEIDKNLQEEKDRRLKLGDDDPLNVRCTKPTKTSRV